MVVTSLAGYNCLVSRLFKKIGRTGSILIQRKTNDFNKTAGLNRLAIAILTCALLVGCSTLRFPGVHRITIQQGNVITQTMIDKLKPGMTRSQVRFVLGNPVLDDSLNRDRWDYVYTVQLAGDTPAQAVLQVYFVEERLSHFEGDFIPTDEKPEKEPMTAET
jgi:outer membrane protein assembly factor BamE